LYTISPNPASIETNPYKAELAAMAKAMRCLVLDLQGRQITIFASNQAALKAVADPCHQSGQGDIEQIYNVVQGLREGGNDVLAIWVPASQEFQLGRAAKQVAQQATKKGQAPQEPTLQAKSTLANRARVMQRKE